MATNSRQLAILTPRLQSELTETQAVPGFSVPIHDGDRIADRGTGVGLFDTSSRIE